MLSTHSPLSLNSSVRPRRPRPSGGGWSQNGTMVAADTPLSSDHLERQHPSLAGF